MSSLRSTRRRGAEVNIVPLVDVLIVLIFFFLVSMQFRNLNTLNLTMPKIETAGKNKMDRQVEVGVDAEGKFYFNSVEVSKEEFTELVKEVSDTERELPVILMADEDAALRNVTFVMDTCRKHGLEKIRLQSR